MSWRQRFPRRMLVVSSAIVACWVATALAEAPNPTNRIIMFSKPAVVQVVCGYVGQWQWMGQTADTALVGSGSGFFINSNGYILTNAHVVSSAKEDDATAQRNMLVDLFSQFLASKGEPVNDANLQAVLQAIQSGQMPEPQLVKSMRIAWIFLQSGKRFPFEIKAYGSPIGGEGAEALTGKDVAVLKIEVRNAPILKLGDSDQTREGAVVHVMGYPAAAESDALDERSALEPTTNKGEISARKTSRDGTPILQTSTSATHGNSGGPVLNEAGEVIGQLTFRGNTVGGQEVQGFNFIVPANTAMEFVRQAGTENVESPIDTKWRKGLEHYWNGEYSAAKSEFQDVVALFPDHSEAQKLITECQEHIVKGDDKVPAAKAPAGSADSGTPTWVWIAAGGGGGLVLLIVILVVVLGGKKKPAAPYYPPGALPQGAMPPGGMMGPGPLPMGAPPMAGPPGGMMGPGPLPMGAPPMGAPPAAPVVARTELFQAPVTARIQFLAGPLQGQEIPIGPGLTLGRDPSKAQVIVGDSQVSSRHLWIGPGAGGFVAKDLGSTNGTFHNGNMAQRVTEVPLHNNDQLALGGAGTVLLVFKA